MNRDRIYGISDAASATGYSTETLRRLEAAGVVTPMRDSEGRRLSLQPALQKQLVRGRWSPAAIGSDSRRNRFGGGGLSRVSHPKPSYSCPRPPRTLAQVGSYDSGEALNTRPGKLDPGNPRAGAGLLG